MAISIVAIHDHGGRSSGIHIPDIASLVRRHKITSARMKGDSTGSKHSDIHGKFTIGAGAAIGPPSDAGHWDGHKCGWRGVGDDAIDPRSSGRGIGSTTIG